ncbi:hypothetical protein GJV85_13360 (plasmid) [Sulfurimonas aquatica]|uniref:Peptidase C14 caspase domain-containing protein n=1 Tax=Sulfurimonas aquatica TaxID=2672570 RepID=A0A975B2W9_9BACT|nr:caspase family protein [Sulfurimonas aquatica]QSZ43158.1 hypothetical protein GJV85_13360 [Sulfurimonas aquatica]
MYATTSIRFLLALLLSSSLYSMELYWSKESRRYETPISANKPIEALQSDFAKQVQEYMKSPALLKESLSREFIKKPIYPKKPNKPVLGKSKKVQRKQFETKEEYNSRKQKLLKQKELEDKKAIEQYNIRLQNYKERLEYLNDNYNKQVLERNERIKKVTALQREEQANIKKLFLEKMRNLQRVIPIYAQKSLARYLGKPKLSFIEYDVDKEIAQLKLYSQYNNFSQLVNIDIQRDSILKLKENIESVDIFYKLEAGVKEGSESSMFSRLAFKSLNLEYDSKTYLASIASDSMKLSYNTEIIAPKVAILKEDAVVLQELIEQDEKKEESLSIENIAYRVTPLHGDELLSEIKSLKPVEVNPRKWLFLIAIEKYAKTDSVAYAKNSALSFIEVAKKALGVPQNQIIRLINEEATAASIKDQLRYLSKRVPKGDTIYFYYSGHGVPDIREGNRPYLLPQDKMAQYVTEDKKLALESIYKSLQRSRASRVIAFIDSCFSGSTDNKTLFSGVAASRLQARAPELKSKKIVALTAGRHDQFSNMYKEKEHRLFSYYLIKSLIRGEKNIADIYNFVRSSVRSKSLQMGDLYEQEPTLQGSRRIEL